MNVLRIGHNITLAPRSHNNGHDNARYSFMPQEVARSQPEANASEIFL